MAKAKGMRGVQRGVNKTNVSLQSIASVLDNQSQMLQQIQDNSAQVQDNKSGGGTAALQSIQIARAQLQLQRDTNNHLKKIQEAANKQIEALQRGNKDWKSFGDKFKDFKTNMKDAFDPTNIKKKLLGPFTMFKGARDKIEDMDYMKRMKALGSSKSDKQLKADAISSRTSKEDALRAQDKIERLRRLGANDKQINSSAAMADRTAALNQFNMLNGAPNTNKGVPISAQDANNKMGGNVAGKSVPINDSISADANNKMGGNVAGKSVPLNNSTSSDANNKMGGNPSENPLLLQQAQHETQIEMLRQNTQQTDLLQQIAANTAAMSGVTGSSAGGKEDRGNNSPNKTAGAMNGMADAFSGIGSAIGSMGQGVGQGIGSLIGGVFSGIMQGIADGIAAFGTLKTVKGIAAIGLLTGVMYGMVQVFDSFSQLDWDSVNQGLLTIGAVVVAAAVVGKFASHVAIGAVAIAALGAALWVVGQAFQAIGDGFQSMNDGLTQLAGLDGSNLFLVAGGITAIGAALAAFAIGNVAAGIGTLISNLLTAGQDSPIAQLQQLASMGNDLQNAASGIQQIGSAMTAFSKVDKNAIAALNDFPWTRATAFVAAGGAMNVDGAKVYATSKTNADTNARTDASNAKAGGGNVVSTQVNQNSTQNQMVKSGGARNTESSYAKYLSARY